MVGNREYIKGQEQVKRLLCQLSPVMGPPVFGQDGPLAQVTLVES